MTRAGGQCLCVSARASGSGAGLAQKAHRESRVRVGEVPTKMRFCGLLPRLFLSFAKVVSERALKISGRRGFLPFFAFVVYKPTAPENGTHHTAAVEKEQQRKKPPPSPPPTLPLPQSPGSQTPNSIHIFCVRPYRPLSSAGSAPLATCVRLPLSTCGQIVNRRLADI